MNWQAPPATVLLVEVRCRKEHCLNQRSPPTQTQHPAGNRGYEKAIRAVTIDVKNGLSVSDSLAKFPELFPRLLISLIVVGERTGSLSEILITFSDFYEEDVDNKLKDLTAVLEPVLLLIMGVLVGSIAFSIILPIYQLVGHFT